MTGPERSARRKASLGDRQTAHRGSPDSSPSQTAAPGSWSPPQPGNHRHGVARRRIDPLRRTTDQKVGSFQQAAIDGLLHPPQGLTVACKGAERSHQRLSRRFPDQLRPFLAGLEPEALPQRLGDQGQLLQRDIHRHDLVEEGQEILAAHGSSNRRASPRNLFAHFGHSHQRVVTDLVRPVLRCLQGGRRTTISAKPRTAAPAEISLGLRAAVGAIHRGVSWSQFPGGEPPTVHSCWHFRHRTFSHTSGWPGGRSPEGEKRRDGCGPDAMILNAA